MVHAMNDDRTDTLFCLHPECSHDIVRSHLLKTMFCHCLVYRNCGNRKGGVGKNLLSYCVNISAHREIAYGVGTECPGNDGLLNFFVDTYPGRGRPEIDIDFCGKAFSYPATLLPPPHDHGAADSYPFTEFMRLYAFCPGDVQNLRCNRPFLCLLHLCTHIFFSSLKAPDNYGYFSDNRGFPSLYTAG